jgi:spore germination cell wall hydrolase CwlJ-like protein
MFQTRVVEKIKTHILCSITFTENLTVKEEIWRNSRAVHATEDNMAHARYLLYT